MFRSVICHASGRQSTVGRTSFTPQSPGLAANRPIVILLEAVLIPSCDRSFARKSVVFLTLFHVRRPWLPVEDRFYGRCQISILQVDEVTLL